VGLRADRPADPDRVGPPEHRDQLDAHDLDPADHPREQIGRYVVLKAIGEGGMGVVLAAYDADLDRKVALKILRDGHARRLGGGGADAPRGPGDGPSVAPERRPGVRGGRGPARRLFLAMEYIEGVTLREWLDAAPRSWREVLACTSRPGAGWRPRTRPG
jgi:serine/threonine protein kinase